MRLGLGTDISVGYRQPLFGGVPFLLDTYTGAAAAYSLRQLRTGVTNVVRVREDSGNTEQDFTAEEIIDGTLLSFVGAGNNGYVVTWYDQSGNTGRDATQSTAANQPKIVSAGSLITQGSKTSIDFGTIAENKSLEASTSSTTNNFISVVHNVTYRFSKNQVLLALSNNNYIILAAADSGKLRYTNSNDNLISTTNIGSFQLSTIDINDGKLYTNGSEEDSVVAVSGETSRYIIGNYTSTSANELEGYVSEIIVFGSAQSSNRTAIEANINEYYSIYP